jgi:SOS-response transcriptional repressor LexA
MPKYTHKQGQYLAFIYYYTKIHGVPPAGKDMERFFKTEWGAVHRMIQSLAKSGFIEKEPRTSRSIRLLLSRDEIPDLGRYRTDALAKYLQSNTLQIHVLNRLIHRVNGEALAKKIWICNS